VRLAQSGGTGAGLVALLRAERARLNRPSNSKEGEPRGRHTNRDRRSHRWAAERGAETARNNSPPFGGLYVGQPERAAAALKAWDAAHPKPAVTLADVADHIEHVRQVAGVDHVGLGSDFDGIPETPTGLEGVGRFPALLQELARRGWRDADLARVAGGNLLRVLSQVEAVSARLRAARSPSRATLEALDGPAKPAGR
jgi:membrane dipeptidase